MSRIVLSILRQAAGPLTSRDTALELLVEWALGKNDQWLLRIMSAGKRTRPVRAGGRGSTCCAKSRAKIYPSCERR